ncbi:5050_t:CDS:1, partial [Gigaspora rosea]
ITDIEVLKTKNANIDNEITKVIQQINAYKFLRDLDANQAQVVQQFKELKTHLLPKILK